LTGPHRAHPSLLAFESIVFDFDGTLADSNTVKRDVFIDVAAEMQVPSELMKLALDTIKGDRSVLFSYLAKQLNRPENWIQSTVERYTALSFQRISAAPEIPNAELVLKTLKSRGLSLYVCSNTPENPLKDILQARKMERYFKKIVGGPGTKTDNLKILLRNENLNPRLTLFVGDNEIDRNAAESAGCPYAGLTNPFSDYKKPLDWELARLDELLK
jgi:phosphoglycolate phosphatase-like HAD superfamily hydrolase